MRRRSIVWAAGFQERGSRPSWFAFGGPIARVSESKVWWQAKSQPWDVKPPLNRSAGFTERGICLRLSTATPLAHSPRRRLSQQTDPPRFLSDGPRREWIPSRPAMERSQGKPPPRSIALAARVFLQGQCIRPAPSPGSSHAGSAAHPPSELRWVTALCRPFQKAFLETVLEDVHNEHSSPRHQVLEVHLSAFGFGAAGACRFLWPWHALRVSLPSPLSWIPLLAFLLHDVLVESIQHLLGQRRRAAQQRDLALPIVFFLFAAGSATMTMLSTSKLYLKASAKSHNVNFPQLACYFQSKTEESPFHRKSPAQTRRSRRHKNWATSASSSRSVTVCLERGPSS